MKGRTHRLQSTDPQDDWVDGSWTVDCVCGINFDDGEEMVNCDECGVWVHTRCSRFTKSDESFACDKCKSKSRDYNEEAEVAKLLVELPNSTKPVRMESSFVAHVPPRHSFRLWTDIPIEERVHVQGLPGGDPVLFSGLSGLFTRELWKCTGYVPKKFSFRYREFQCWEDDIKKHKKSGEEGGNGNENLVGNGAGELFLSSKEGTFGYPVFQRKEVLKEVKLCEDDELVHRNLQSQIGSKKDGDLLHPIVVQPVTDTDDITGVSKDVNGKNSKIVFQRETHNEKKDSLSPKSGRSTQYCNSDLHPIRSKIMNQNPRRFTSDSRISLLDGIQKPSLNLEHSSEASTPDPSGHKLPVQIQLKEGKALNTSPVAFNSPHKTGLALGSIMEQKDGNATSFLVEEEACLAPGSSQGTITSSLQLHGSLNRSPRRCLDLLVKGVAPTVLELKSGQILEDANPDLSQSFAQADGNMNIEVNDVSRGGVSSVEVKDAETSFCNVSPCLVADPSDQHHPQLFGDKVQNNISDPKHVFRSGIEPLKSGESCVESEATTHQLKAEACAGKLLSTEPGYGMHVSSTADNSNRVDIQNFNLCAKQTLISSSNVAVERDHAENGVVKDGKYTLSQKIVKERQTSVGYPLKGFQQTRDSHSCSKKLLCDSKDSVPFLKGKDSVPYASSKVTSAQNVSLSSGSVESAELLQNQCSRGHQSKGTGHDLMLKAEKSSQSNNHPSKISNASFSNSCSLSNCPAALSDEELALLLHQELNSSPRVPRVPRVRQSGSFPQLASSTAMSMLVKRTSGSGGKDQNLTSRRKHKDGSREGVQNSREHDTGSKKIENMQSPLDHMRHDAGHSSDSSKKRENKNLPPVSKMNAGPSTSSGANDLNLSSIRNSPNHMSDDDAGTVRALGSPTLPGLINDIMSKGRRMTYDELCNAVLPHWPNLRKHNGERYAYSSHTQAVLDCLRNRHEWAQLVDRGPKTNSTKRRRKVDAEDSENEYGSRVSKEADSKNLESQRDDFPKGKRKARKRRRLALQGRGIRDVQRRRKADLSDGENGPFSNSSGESMFSDDEIEGGEASASSDELGTA